MKRESLASRHWGWSSTTLFLNPVDSRRGESRNLAERTQSSRRDRATQTLGRLKLADRTVLRTAAPNEPNSGRSGPGWFVAPEFGRAIPSQERPRLSAGSAGGYGPPNGPRPIPEIRRHEPLILPNEPNFGAAREERKPRGICGLRPNTASHRTRRTNPNWDRSGTGRRRSVISSRASLGEREGFHGAGGVAGISATPAYRKTRRALSDALAENPRQERSGSLARCPGGVPQPQWFGSAAGSRRRRHSARRRRRNS